MARVSMPVILIIDIDDHSALLVPTVASTKQQPYYCWWLLGEGCGRCTARSVATHGSTVILGG